MSGETAGRKSCCGAGRASAALASAGNAEDGLEILERLWGYRNGTVAIDTEL